MHDFSTEESSTVSESAEKSPRRGLVAIGVNLDLLLLLPGKTLCLAVPDVTLGQPLACLDQLHHVDELLGGHDGEADDSQNPGPEAVHLVDAGHFEGRRAIGVDEELAQDRRVDLGALMDRRCGAVW